MPILPNEIPGEVFRAADADEDIISIGKVVTPSGVPGLYIGTLNSDTECNSAVVLTLEEAVAMLIELGKALYGVPDA